MKKIFNLIPLLLVVYITKSFIVQPSLFDFGVISLMSIGFFFKMKLDKDVSIDKEELKSIITQLESEVNDKLYEVKKTIDKDRLDSETKFSNVNLNLQYKPQKQKEAKPYGWG